MAKLTEEQRSQRALKRARKDAQAAEEQANRREERRQRWIREDTYLSWEELKSGVHCRGCGEPIIDRLGNRPALMNMTTDERAEHEKEDARFSEKHQDCREARWTIDGSRTAHCGLCCPPPPFSPSKLKEIAELISSFGKPKEGELDVWRLLLTCDHTVNRTQHHTNTYWTSSVVECQDCRAQRGVVEKTRIGRANEIQSDEELSDKQISRERLKAELKAEERKLERHRKTLSNVERRANHIRSQIESIERKSHQEVEGSSD